MDAEGDLWSPFLVCKATVQKCAAFPRLQTLSTECPLKGFHNTQSASPHPTTPHTHQELQLPLNPYRHSTVSIQRKRLEPCYKYGSSRDLIKSLWKNTTERWHFLCCPSPSSQLPGCVTSPITLCTNTWANTATLALMSSPEVLKCYLKTQPRFWNQTPSVEKPPG